MALGMSAVHALLIPTVFGVVFLVIEDDHQAQFLDHVRGDAQMFSAHLAPELKKRSAAKSLGVFVEDALLSGRIVFLEIVEGEKVVLRKSAGTLNAPGQFKEDFFFGQHDDGIYYISMPLSNETAGVASTHLRLGYDEGPARQWIEKVFRYGLYIAGGYVVFTVLLIGLLTPYLTRPLKQLRDAAHEIAQGDHSASFVPKTRLVEVTSLAGDLEHMRRELLDQRDKIIASHEQLENKVAERTVELRQASEELTLARDKAMESVRLKSQFLATMSHEIRTPMNGVLGMLGLLQDGNLEPKDRDYLEVAIRSAQALLALLNDILDLSRIEAGRLHIEQIKFDVRLLVEHAVALTAQSAQEKHLETLATVSPQVPKVVHGDPARLQQVLGNLIANAIKFTAEGSVTVNVTLEPGAEGSEPEGKTGSSKYQTELGVLHFEIKDTGIGIDREAQARIFEPFVQGDGSTTRQYGGTGLGLSISKQLVGLMGGEIGVGCIPGQGCLFWFTVPVTVAETRPPDTLSGPSRDNDKPVSINQTANCNAPILVAEDNLINQKVATAMLTKLGYRTEIVPDGEKALAAIKGNYYSLVLMDCQMPRMDGYQATRKIRKQETGQRHIPIIAMTANAMNGDREHCLSVGMDDYIAKPFTLDTLKTTLEKWLDRKNAR